MPEFPLDSRPLRITATLKPEDTLFECQKWDVLHPEHPLLEDDFDWDLLDRSVAYSISDTNRSFANRIICGVRGRLNYNFEKHEVVHEDDTKDYFLHKGMNDVYIPGISDTPDTTARATIYSSVDTDFGRYVMQFLICTPISLIHKGKLYIPQDVSRRLVQTISDINAVILHRR